MKEVKDIIREFLAARGRAATQDRSPGRIGAESRQKPSQVIRRIKRTEALKKLQEAVNKARTTTVWQGVT
jgi:hypothetical protein